MRARSACRFALSSHIDVGDPIDVRASAPGLLLMDRHSIAFRIAEGRVFCRPGHRGLPRRLCRSREALAPHCRCRPLQTRRRPQSPVRDRATRKPLSWNSRSRSAPHCIFRRRLRNTARRMISQPSFIPRACAGDVVRGIGGEGYAFDHVETPHISEVRKLRHSLEASGRFILCLDQRRTDVLI